MEIMAPTCREIYISEVWYVNDLTTCAARTQIEGSRSVVIGNGGNLYFHNALSE